MLTNLSRKSSSLLMLLQHTKFAENSIEPVFLLTHYKYHLVNIYEYRGLYYLQVCLSLISLHNKTVMAMVTYFSDRCSTHWFQVVTTSVCKWICCQQSLCCQLSEEKLLHLKTPDDGSIELKHVVLRLKCDTERYKTCVFLLVSALIYI
jgi:hypothetical protein